MTNPHVVHVGLEMQRQTVFPRFYFRLPTKVSSISTTGTIKYLYPNPNGLYKLPKPSPIRFTLSFQFT